MKVILICKLYLSGFIDIYVIQSNVMIINGICEIGIFRSSPFHVKNNFSKQICVWRQIGIPSIRHRRYRDTDQSHEYRHRCLYNVQSTCKKCISLFLFSSKIQEIINHMTTIYARSLKFKMKRVPWCISLRNNLVELSIDTQTKDENPWYS